jgi:hypothetical protein
MHGPMQYMDSHRFHRLDKASWHGSCRITLLVHPSHCRKVFQVESSPFVPWIKARAIAPGIGLTCLQGSPRKSTASSHLPYCCQTWISYSPWSTNSRTQTNTNRLVRRGRRMTNDLVIADAYDSSVRRCVDRRLDRYGAGPGHGSSLVAAEIGRLTFSPQAPRHGGSLRSTWRQRALPKASSQRRLTSRLLV